MFRTFFCDIDEKYTLKSMLTIFFFSFLHTLCMLSRNYLVDVYLLGSSAMRLVGR
jgi:hypothetical protein